jgi:hypothetical protein
MGVDLLGDRGVEIDGFAIFWISVPTFKTIPFPEGPKKGGILFFHCFDHRIRSIV